MGGRSLKIRTLIQKPFHVFLFILTVIDWKTVQFSYTNAFNSLITYHMAVLYLRRYFCTSFYRLGYVVIID